MKTLIRSDLRAFLIALLTAFVLPGAVTSTASAGPIIADSGFKVNPNGFSFPNYGNDEGYQNLNGSQMRRLYGNSVCLSGRGASCVLSPAARSWMNEMNEAMGGGHCYGFAALSSIIQRNQLPKFGYESLAPFGGGTTAFGLGIESNRQLQSAIARAWTLQTLPAVTSRMIQGSPKEILEALVRELNPGNPETFTMTIFQPGFEGGHAITPLSVEDLGDGKFEVHVYDNNWPDDDQRVVKIDTVADTWSYLAATNPNQPGSVYRGNARTRTMRLMPTRPGYRLHDCSFCVGRKGAKSKFNTVTLSSPGDEHAHLLITDQNGRRTGFVDGRLVNEIPGARVMPRTAGGPRISADGEVTGPPNSLEPAYMVPRRLALRIKVDGSNLSRLDRESVNVVGPTFDSTVENVRVGPGRNAHLTLSPRKQTLSFTGAAVERSTPTVTFGAESPKAAYRIKVTAPGAPSRGTFFFAKKPKYGFLRIASKSKAPQRYRVQIDRYTEKGLTKFARRYAIRGQQEAYLYYAPLVRPNGVARVAIGEPGKKKVRVLKLRRKPAAG